jgi:hypothetical protein
METTKAKRQLSITWLPGLLLFLVILLPAALKAQQQTTDKDKKPAETGNEGPPPIALGVSVDAARKSPDLPTTATIDDNAGETWGGYVVKQSAEFGGRISDFTGNQGTWDTYVNMGTGPRLLEYSLDMHSPDHTGLLFDDLNMSNFGYGGDPSNVSRLRFSKGDAYSFGAVFRRDQNIFDYNLLANPLNPPTSNPNVPILNSPHEFLLTRRMTDTSLNLFPLAKIRFRVGWSRVVNEGETFSTTHQGTEGLVFQPTLNTTDTYTGGISFRFIPRTNINYDQFYTYFKGDTTGHLASPFQQGLFGIPTASFFLVGGIPVSLGVPFNTVAGQPCATPILGTGFVNPACSGFFGYGRSGRNRNSYPTEQLSMQSTYFKRVDFSARFSYTGAEADTPDLVEMFSGLITRTRQRAFATGGSALAKRIAVTGDFGITFRITDKFRLIDNFLYNNFRIPGSWNQTTTSFFGATLLSNPNAFNLATCPPPFTAATCPQHSAGSGPDVANDIVNQFLRQETKINTIEAEYDFTRRVSGYVGFRYERRDITDNVTDSQSQTFFPSLPNRGNCAGLPVVGGVCTVFVPNVFPAIAIFTEINAYSALIGFSARPSKNLRFNFDTEQYYADNTFTRISPRHLQIYKGRVHYRPSNWVSFGGAVNIRENRNDTADIGNLQHNRSYAINGVFAPPEGKWSVDLSYTYNDIFSQTNICFVATPTPPGALSCGTPFLSGVSTYTETSNIGGGSIYLNPISRVKLGVGYTVTSSNGSTLILNPNAPTGPLAFNYHLPLASLAIDISKHLTYKTGWNYYYYNEKSNAGPTLPRDFRGNTFTLSLRYSM